MVDKIFIIELRKDLAFARSNVHEEIKSVVGKHRK